MHVDGIGRHVEEPRHRGADAVRRLRPGPDLHAIGTDVGRAVHRLHGRVHEQRILVDRLHRLLARAGGAHGALARRDAGVGIVVDPRVIARARRGRGVLPVRPRIPVDHQRVATLHRRPRVVGQHRHARRQQPLHRVELHHLPHARHRARLAVVHAPQRAAERRAAGDAGVQHVRHPDVDAEFRGAVHLVRDVEPGSGLAENAEGAGVLQRHLATRHGLPGRERRQLPVGRGALGRSVGHHAGHRRALRRRHAPLRRRRPYQHRTRGGTRPAQRHVRAAGAPAAAGAGVVLAVGRRPRHPHLAPVGVEFLGHDHRHRGPHPLAHLRLGGLDGDRAVRVDAQPEVRRPSAGSDPGSGRVERGGQRVERAEAEHECGAGSGRGGHELAATDGLLAHLASPLPAARWMARRMRRYVAQRQMLSLMPLSMSTSVGCGVDARSAAAAMSCPDWQ